MSDLMTKELLTLHVNIGCPTVGWDFGRALLGIFTDLDPRLAPQTLHIWSRKAGDFTDLDAVKPHWATLGQSRNNGSLFEFAVGLEWRRRLTTKYQAEIKHETKDMRGRKINAGLSVYAVPNKGIDWLAFAHKIYACTQPEIAFMHIHRDAHKRADQSGAREPMFAPHDCTDVTIPNLAWSTYLGPKYSTQANRAALGKTTARVDEIGDGVAITLSNAITDICTDFAAFDSTRDAAKTCFPSGFFAPFSAR